MKNAGVKDSATTLANGVRADGPELVIGVVGAVGTDLALVLNKLRESLTDVSYYVPEPLHLIEALHQIERWKEVAEVPLDVRIDEHMNMGNTFREEVGLGESVALLGGVAGIRRERKSGPGETEDSPVPRCAYLLRSLKHHDEVETLRRIYGSAFLLVAAHSPLETRLDRLASEIAESYHVFQTNKYRAQAAHLNQRDESEPDKKFGQNVRKTFPLADVFIDASDPTDLGRSVKRFVELLFGYQFHTPTRDEFAMFHAQAAALRSASLGRQVGAVVVTKDGDIIAVGTNEVPKASGGLYWVTHLTIETSPSLMTQTTG